MQVLRERRTTREFAPDKLPSQLLSNLLWAAFGVNRPDGKRTAPSAMNWQEMDVYVAMSKGLFLYDAKGNRHVPVLDQDIRQVTGTQTFVATAPLNLIYVADLSKTGSGPDADLFTAADAGLISQNVYLFCASENLATVVRGSIDRVTLARTMEAASGTEDYVGANCRISEEVVPRSLFTEGIPLTPLRWWVSLNAPPVEDWRGVAASTTAGQPPGLQGLTAVTSVRFSIGKNSRTACPV